MASAAILFAALFVQPRLEAGKPVWDIKTLSKPPAVFPAPDYRTNDMESLFFEGPAYRGKPTRVFAYMGMPKNSVGKKVPGIVLVHGGGGTAFDEWVRLWNGRGYAAIAMDTCGCTPGGAHASRPRHDLGGPPGWGGFEQIDEPREDQWTYHAVAAAILAHSLLRAQPDVDPERIGLTGISWGGYLTCIIAGVDSRFKFAVPVYGCGFYGDTVFDGNLKKLTKEGAARWLEWWDPSVYLPDAQMPVLWVTGSNDFAYPLDALQKSYRLTKAGRTLCIRLRMPHGHGGPGEAPKEIQAFADSLFNQGDPLVKITGQGREESRVWAAFESKRPVAKAELNFTRETGPWQQRKWDSIPAQLESTQVSSVLPEGAKVWYLNLIDDRDCAVSTEHEVLP
jgi:dienelactone hydrolase